MHEPVAWPVESEKKKATQKSKVWDTKFTLHIANCKPTPFGEHICTESDFGSLYLQNISLHKKKTAAHLDGQTSQATTIPLAEG